MSMRTLTLFHGGSSSRISARRRSASPIPTRPKKTKAATSLTVRSLNFLPLAEVKALELIAVLQWLLNAAPCTRLRALSNHPSRRKRIFGVSGAYSAICWSGHSSAKRASIAIFVIALRRTRAELFRWRDWTRGSTGAAATGYSLWKRCTPRLLTRAVRITRPVGTWAWSARSS
jgi:hypothetical protein